jgi:hypothetical protein
MLLQIAIANARRLAQWKELYRYWRSKHIGDRPPARQNIDPPLEIPSLVANLKLMESTDGGDYRYRLAERAIEACAGAALTGQRIGVSPIPAGLAAQWRAGLDAVWLQCAPKLFVSRFADGVAVRHITLMLLLATKTRETEQIMIGCFF